MRKNKPKKRFTQEQFEKALAIPLMPFLEQRGYEFKRCGNEFHMKDHDSFVVSNNLWCWNSQNMGGNILGFLTKVEQMNIVDAVLMLCNENTQNIEYTKTKFIMPDKANKKIILPLPNTNSRRVFSYLMKTRGIDKEIIADLMHQGKIYESRECFVKVQTKSDIYENAKLADSSTFVDLERNKMIAEEKETQKGGMLGFDYNKKLKYIGVLKIDEESLAPYLKSGYLKDIQPIYNCVFCGFDEIGNIKYASMRGITTNSTFRQDVIGSDKQYGFEMVGTSDKVYVFEAPIDLMSHANLFKLCSLDWQKDNRITLGGVSELALDRFLEQHSHIKKITFCLDNDRTGKNNVYGVYDEKQCKLKTRSLLQTYQEKDYEVYVSFPATKDYNMDLMTYHSEHEIKNTECYEDDLEE